MLRRLSNHRGQNAAEYVIVFALIIAAAVAMQTYIKRGLQGRMKDATDKAAKDTPELGTTTQYEPYYSEQSMTAAQKSSSETTTAAGAAKQVKSQQESSRTGYQEYKDTSGAD